MILVALQDGKCRTGEPRRGSQREYLFTAIVLRDRVTMQIVREWRVSDPREPTDTEHPPSKVFVAQNESSLVFSPDSKHLAWSRLSDHPGVDLVEVDREQPFGTIPVESPVWCLAFSPDGSLIASGHTDSTVRVWNPRHQAFVR